MRGRPCGLDASALIDGNIDDDGASLHLRNHGASHQLGRGVGRPRSDPRIGDPHFLLEKARQTSLFGQRHHRHQTGARHKIVVIEHSGIGREPMGHLHRKCLSHAGRLLRKEHQSSQLRRHFPHFDTRNTTNSSVDRGLGRRPGRNVPRYTQAWVCVLITTHIFSESRRLPT